MFQSIHQAQQSSENSEDDIKAKKESILDPNVMMHGLNRSMQMGGPQDPTNAGGSNTAQAMFNEEDEKPGQMKAIQKAGVEEEEPVQGKAIQKAEEEEEVQMKESSTDSAQSTTSGTSTQSSLPKDVNARMEASFGANFSNVNIHTNDSKATQMKALAFTQGNNVHFAPGQYNPHTSKGQELIGHEYTHVVQQGAGRVAPTRQAKGMAINDNPALENEADVMGKKAAEGKSADVNGSGTQNQVQRKFATAHDANSLAKTVHDAIKGAGTDEDAIHDVLNHDAAKIRQVVSVYNSKYNDINGKGMIQDIISDTSGRTLELALYQLKRAGVAIPESKIDNNISIIKGGVKGDKQNAKPGTEVKYSVPAGFDDYEWYVLNNPYSRQIADKNESWYKSIVPIYEGGSKNSWSESWDYPGVHTVACRAEHESGKIFYYEKDEHIGNPAEDIPKEHASYEVIAHQVAYMNENEFIKDNSVSKLLESWNYNSEEIIFHNGKYSLNMVVIPPIAGSGQLPVVAFRGTQEFLDIVADLDTPGPGYYQYKRNKALITSIFNALPSKAIVTGHSLGGALAQYAAVDFPSKIQSVVTFQSPGINASMAQSFNSMEESERPDATHHLANNDVVDLSGDKHLDGDFYLHHLKNAISPIQAHTSFLFTSPNFKEFRDLMGIEDSYYEGMGKEVFEDKYFIEHFNKHPNPVKKSIVEAIRSAI